MFSAEVFVLTYNMDITAARIKAAREQAGLTLSYVAEYCGVQQYQTVSKWEKGNGKPSLGNLLKLCELFNCELGYLLGEYEGKTREITDVKQKTGLDENSILTLFELSNLEDPLKDAAYIFLRDLLNSVQFLPLAISYKKYKDGVYKSDGYYVFDEHGNPVDFLDGDVAGLLLRQSFDRFVSAEGAEYSRSERRKEANNLTEEAIAEWLIEGKRGK